MKNFAICIDNTGFEVSLEKMKLYEYFIDDTLPDKSLINVIDESGEPYIYPSNIFIPMDIPDIIKEKLEFA